ncbi:hypothetical protein M0805_001643 [Coniferiporia weirii]|nr:hypothetical protein M0805_001643 [Coniferiporia weirii]
MYIINQVCLVVIQISVGVIMATRTYGLYGRGRRMCMFLIIIFICALAVGSWSVTGKSTTSSPVVMPSISGCHTTLEKEEEIRLISAWGALLVYDTVVFFLTLWKAVDIWKTGPSRLFHVLVRDGELVVSQTSRDIPETWRRVYLFLV